MIHRARKSEIGRTRSEPKALKRRPGRNGNQTEIEPKSTREHVLTSFYIGTNPRPRPTSAAIKRLQQRTRGSGWDGEGKGREGGELGRLMEDGLH